MMANYRKVQAIVESLNLRERGIFLSALLLVIFAVWYTLWFASVNVNKEQANVKYQTLATDERNLKQQIQILIDATSTDVYQDKKQQLSQLQKRQNDLDEELARLSQGLVSAQKLSQLLHDVLQKTQTVELIEMTTLPTMTQTLSDDDSSRSDEEPVMGVYQHGVTMLVRGGFSEINSFLVELESLPWRFYWESLQYEVTQYPNASVKINVYTLSAEEGFLGV